MTDYTPTVEDIRNMVVSFGNAMDSLLYATQEMRAKHGYRDSLGEYFDRWLTERDRAQRAIGWDERGIARPSYLGPDDGHELDCLGWGNCICASFPNPYREVSK